MSVIRGLDVGFGFDFDLEIFDTVFTIFWTDYYFYEYLSIFLTGLDTGRTSLTFLSHLRKLEETIFLTKLLSVSFLALVLGRSFKLDLVCRLCLADLLFFEAEREIIACFLVGTVSLPFLKALELFWISFGAFLMSFFFIGLVETIIEDSGFFILLLGKLLKKYRLATVFGALFGLLFLVLDTIFILWKFHSKWKARVLYTIELGLYSIFKKIL